MVHEEEEKEDIRDIVENLVPNSGFSKAGYLTVSLKFPLLSVFDRT